MERTYVTLSYAQSLDGRIATVTGDSQWIGGPESLTFAHELRRDNQAILVGVGTGLKDNPRLTCRLPGGRNPVRIVLDERLETPVESALVTGTTEAPTWIICGADAPADRMAILRSRGVRVEPRGRNLGKLLIWLAEQGIRTLFVEGGAGVLTAFVRDGLADRLVVVTAPFVIGKGTEALGDLGSTVLQQVDRPLRWKRWELGADSVTELIYREAGGPEVEPS